MADLPGQAPANNHRVTQVDRTLRNLQQSILHGLRLFGHTYELLHSENSLAQAEETFQKGWKQLADTYFKMEEPRKEAAIPGSTAVETNHLFDKQDINQALLNQKIKGFRSKGYASYGGRPPSYSFRPSSRFGFRGKGFQPTSKGFGGFRGGFKGKSPSNNYGSHRGQGRGMAPPKNKDHDGPFFS